MLRKTLLLILLTSFSSLINAQESPAYTVRTGFDIFKQIPAGSIYSYPQFLTGRVIYEDNSEVEALLNNNLIRADIEFISNTVDTSILTNKENIKLVIIGIDTFYNNGNFLKAVNDYTRLNIAVEDKFAVVGRKKSRGEGHLYSTPTFASVGHTLKDWQQPYSLNENFVIARKNFYFIGDSFNNFKPLNKKNLLKAFKTSSGSIETYIRDNNLNLNKEADVVRLLTFLNQL